MTWLCVAIAYMYVIGASGVILLVSGAVHHMTGELPPRMWRVCLIGVMWPASIPVYAVAAIVTTRRNRTKG